jgi:hypothetical protein
MSVNWQAVGAVGAVLGALGAFLVAILAIWGDMIKSRLYGPKMRLKLHKDKGELAPIFQFHPKTGDVVDKTVAHWFHLNVTNDRPRVPARNCRVLLKEIYREESDGQFRPAQLSVPRQFAWGPPVNLPLCCRILQKSMCSILVSQLGIWDSPQSFTTRR